MASYNSYVEYKRETKQLLHWAITSFNTIITLASSSFTDEGGQSGSITDDQMPLVNKFEVLGVDHTQGAAGDGEDSDSRTMMKWTLSFNVPDNASSRDQDEPSLPDVSLGSYNIVDDIVGIVTDYLLATYAIAHECTTLRHFVQDMWRQVAYDCYNSAVAGIVSRLAVAMVQRAELATFMDFPGHDSYETVVNTIARGDIEATRPKVRKQFLALTLLDFVADYQMNRNGVPTRAMKKQIWNWDPALNLQTATESQ
ncbi:hypothetical protein B0J13DRAFT_628499 [Dactylonectria estremocensis]|uniref:DUF6604 domain-containing protein n=1 Tax=Dactylonectria estremocensis TaxID=1079267 RepID=A0A9P9DQU0_9HYPO|nr:hypothetical protein B0J13DRAFT_628499 [Dactylonectria estremocensis]